MIDLVRAEKFAIWIAERAGKLILENKNKIEITEIKDKQDFCTNVDLKSEKLIIDAIKKEYPDHVIISEEIGKVDKKSDYAWIIDPIDGTKNFMRNMPMFCVSIALQFSGETIVGVVFNPLAQMTFHARNGGGTRLNGHKIKVSGIKKLDHSYVYIDSGKIYGLNETDRKKALERLNILITSVFRVHSYGSGALGLCHLAQGSYDIYFDITGFTKLVDVAAGSIIVKEAGGTFSEMDGHFLATNGHLEKKVIELLKV
ncbi:MAG: inositol monophosphatase [Candidatus Aenigmarchaeota archaeon]|nr:inositol monophosphatase [Candidatus Aenigmarchaeota archaeon]